MKYRKLRIAWSVFWSIAAVLLIVLGVRSYWRYDLMRRVTRWSTKLVHTEVCSECGSIGFTVEDALYRIDLQALQVRHWGHESYPSGGRMRPGWNPTQDPRFPMPSFRYHIVLPHWLLAFLLAAFAAVPWMRFSLRTLLIATTRVAMVLGALVLL